MTAHGEPVDPRPLRVVPDGGYPNWEAVYQDNATWVYRTIFARVVVPASTPFILVGMRVGLGSSWATLVAAELIAARRAGRAPRPAAVALTPNVVDGARGVAFIEASVASSQNNGAWTSARMP